MGDSMNYEQKLQALNALAECQVLMRKPGDWYVHQGVAVKEGCMLVGSYGNGTTPEKAIENHWVKLTSIPEDKYLVVDAGKPHRRAVRWNGFMWDAVAEGK